MDDRWSRRDMLQRSAVFGALAITGAMGCGKEKKRLSCMDTSALAPADLQLRTSAAVAYLDTAADPTKTCEHCQQFLPSPAPDTCGSCKVVKGPISPRGGCKLFVAKVA